jgi:hypothetical protein
MKTERLNFDGASGWIPGTTAGTGTIAANGTKFITGTGTTFLSEVERGNYVLVGTNAYKVAEVISDTKLRINETASFTSTALVLATKRVKFAIITVSTSADVTLNGDTVEAGAKEIITPTSPMQNIAPIYVDASSGQVQVLITYK